ncbi:MAG: hypothetical protein U1E36_02260 [Rickettsiales bacterium]
MRKPPIIFGDVSRPDAMIRVKWSAYAQTWTDKPVKGMLNTESPVTILQWSFVRDDQAAQRNLQADCACHPRRSAGSGTGGHPTRSEDRRTGDPRRPAAAQVRLASHSEWAVDCFKLSSSGVADTTQIHTHMCYSEFNDIIDSVAAMDADVISIETSCSAMELLGAFVEFKYPNQIGPGVLRYP